MESEIGNRKLLDLRITEKACGKSRFQIGTGAWACDVQEGKSELQMGTGASIFQAGNSSLGGHRSKTWLGWKQKPVGLKIVGVRHGLADLRNLQALRSQWSCSQGGETGSIRLQEVRVGHTTIQYLKLPAFPRVKKKHILKLSYNYAVIDFPFYGFGF